MYILYTGKGGGGGSTSEKVRWVENTDMTDCNSSLYVNPIKKAAFRVWCLYSYLVHGLVWLLILEQLQLRAVTEM